MTVSRSQIRRVTLAVIVAGAVLSLGILVYSLVSWDALEADEWPEAVKSLLVLISPYLGLAAVALLLSRTTLASGVVLLGSTLTTLVGIVLLFRLLIRVDAPAAKRFEAILGTGLFGHPRSPHPRGRPPFDGFPGALAVLLNGMGLPGTSFALHRGAMCDLRQGKALWAGGMPVVLRVAGRVSKSPGIHQPEIDPVYQAGERPGYSALGLQQDSRKQPPGARSRTQLRALYLKRRLE